MTIASDSRLPPDPTAVTGARSGRASEITETLVGEILSGTLGAGSPLRQAPLADRFEVSRTPIREALHQLVALGLASFEPNHGFRVRGISQSQYLDAMLIRSRLEGLAAERAATRLTVVRLRTLFAIVEELDALGERLSAAGGARYRTLQKQWSRKNEEFHDQVVDAAESPPLSQALASTVRAYPRDVTWLAVERNPNVVEEYARDHHGICDALERCEPALARSRATEHVERTLRYLDLVFQADGPAGEEESMPRSEPASIAAGISRWDP